jgi:cobalt/nickel transport system permease protein
MHIPDGFLDTKTWVSLTVVSSLTLAFAMKKSKDRLGEKQIPLMGVISAFVFVSQLLNFPIAGGTSGHFTGGVLAAILLGPFSGFLIMTTVLIIQYFVFQDGGLTTLGANIFNMGIIGAIFGYYIYLGFLKIFKKISISSFIASYLSVVLASVACAIELAISKTVPLKVALFSMAGVHSLIGIGEGVITSLVLIFLQNTREDLLKIEKI